MSELTAEARKTLKDTFEEVAERATRLSEWIDYQEKLHPLKNSFGVVLAEVKDGITAQGFKDGSFPRIKGNWNTCRDSDLLNLQIFHEGVQYIDKPLGSNKVRYAASRFLELREQIEGDVIGVSAKSLTDHCNEFDSTLTFQLAILRNAVVTETKLLCDLTKGLYRDFARE